MPDRVGKVDALNEVRAATATRRYTCATLPPPARPPPHHFDPPPTPFIRAPRCPPPLLCTCRRPRRPTPSSSQARAASTLSHATPQDQRKCVCAATTPVRHRHGIACAVPSFHLPCLRRATCAPPPPHVFFYPPPPTGFASLQNLFTPLHMAAFNDEIEVATLLIDRGAEPKPEVERGR